MPDVVLVTCERADRPHSGGALRSLRLMQALAARCDLAVVVAGPDSDAEELRRLTGAASVHVFPAGDRPLLTRAWSVQRRWPLEVSRRWVPAAEQRVQSLVHPGSRLVVEHVHLSPYAREGVPFVLSTQNAEHRLAVEQPDLPGWRGLEQRRERRLLGRFEQRAVHRPGVTVVVVSDGDARALGVQAAVVANGADLPERVPPMPPEPRPLFVSSLGYGPNADAVRWWAADIAPLLPGGFPHLRVVGRGAEAVAGVEGIDLVGEVPDVAEHLAWASCVVVPLRYGSGTRLKVLEAMAWGRPVVATTKAVEGLPVTDGLDVLLADDAAGVAAAVVRVAQDRPLAGRLGVAGRLLAERFGWPELGDRFADVVLS